MECGGKWSLIPGSALDTSRAPAGVRQQLSFTGRDTTMNQENWLTAQQASYGQASTCFFCNTYITHTQKKKCKKLKHVCGFETLPWLDAHRGDCYGSRFLSSEQWAACSKTARHICAPPPPFSLCDDMAHTRPPAACEVASKRRKHKCIKDRSPSQEEN